MRLGRSREVFTDRRRAPRSQAKYLQLAYWNGAHGVLRPIREVSSYGAFIETQDRWCADTVLQAQLIAELPLAAQLREAAVQDVSGSENDARQSAGGGNRLLPTKNAPSTEKLSLALSCRIVRLVPEGICVDFTDRSANGKQRRALEGFLTAVEERTRNVEASAKEASADCQQPGAVPSSAPASPAADGPRDKRRFLPRTVVRLFNNCSFRERFSYLWAKILALSTSQFSSRPSIALRATRRNGDLELTWNPDSAPIAAATSGVISIQDGESKRQVSLDAAQLRSGSLLYSPTSDQILIHLTLTTPAGPAGDAVTAIMPKVRRTHPSPIGETPSGSGAAPQPIPIASDESVPPKDLGHRSHEWTKWAQLIAFAILMLVAAWILKRGAQHTAASAATTAEAPFGLQVVSRGKQLEIHWNHDALRIRNAAKGVMRISDSGVEEVIEFDPTQLRDGAVAYSPQSNDVSVRFEVNGLDGKSSSESVRSVAIP